MITAALVILGMVCVVVVLAAAVDRVLAWAEREEEAGNE